MSVASKLKKAAKKALKSAGKVAAAYYTGGASLLSGSVSPFGTSGGLIFPTRTNVPIPDTNFGADQIVNAVLSNGGGFTPAAQIMSLPALPALPGGAMIGSGGLTSLGGTVARSARGLAASAATYCRRHPQWCSTIGMGGVMALLQSGQLPPIKRRRTRGISGREMRSFNKVQRVLSRLCTAPARKHFRSPRKCR